MENGKLKMGRRIGSFEYGLVDGLWLLGGSENTLLLFLRIII